VPHVAGIRVHDVDRHPPGPVTRDGVGLVGRLEAVGCGLAPLRVISLVELTGA
jgi:hypothetical protein